MMFLVLMSLSPVLRTLSAATSSDSIWALAALLFTLNALLADYTANVSEDEINEGYVSICYICFEVFFIYLGVIYLSIYLLLLDRLSSVLSMNAAVSASVVLASRLSTNVSVFALVLFSILSFALFPILRRRLQVNNINKNLFPKLLSFLPLIFFLACSHHVRMRYGY
jgi:phosphatidylinositol glycan class C protein